MRKLVLILLFSIILVGIQAQNIVSGDVYYANNALTYLDSVTVYLKQGSVIINQVNTNSYGHYTFTNVPDGTYQLTATSDRTWGGCNSADAVDILKHYVGISLLAGVKKKAANTDNYPIINANDAVLASKRFAHIIDSFPAGNWVFEVKNISLASSDIRVNIKGSCTGDVNGSYVPPAAFSCGQNITDIRDGQIYPTVLIGEQCWMAKNLNIGTFIYGIGDQTNNYVIEKFCFLNQVSNCNTFGGLYQWWEMMQYDTTPGIQGICPEGFHLPVNAEWDTLIMGLGGYSVAGNALKTGGSSGFNALLAGWVFNCQKFRQMGIQAYFWTSNQYYGIYGYDRILNWNSGLVISTYTNKNDGLSVRCLKD